MLGMIDTSFVYMFALQVAYFHKVELEISVIFIILSIKDNLSLKQKATVDLPLAYLYVCHLIFIFCLKLFYVWNWNTSEHCFYPTACPGIVLTHGVQLGGWVYGR